MLALLLLRLFVCAVFLFRDSLFGLEECFPNSLYRVALLTLSSLDFPLVVKRMIYESPS